MATVYRVYDQRLHVERAIKVLAPEYATKADLRRRFETEASTMARLRHDNIAAVYDVGDDNGAPYLVMELVGGGSLNDFVQVNGPLAPRLAAQVCIAVLRALQVAHDNGIVHRDIKPHNVLLTPEGVAKVTDFGIARVQSDDSPSMTRTGSVMGTWAYMAPEQRAGARGLDGRADVYSTGAMLMDLLTGDAPADVFMCEMHTHMLDGVPEALRPVVQRAVRYVPAERYTTAQEMAEALTATLPMLPEVPEEHPKLGQSKAPMPTISPSGPHSGPHSGPAATYALDDVGDPTVAQRAAFTVSPDVLGPTAATAPPAPRLRRARRAVMLVCGLLGLLVGGAWAYSTWGEPDPVPADPIGTTPDVKPGGVSPTLLAAATPDPIPEPPVIEPAAAPVLVASTSKPAAKVVKPVATPVEPAVAVPEVVHPAAAPPPAPAADGSFSVTGDADSAWLVAGGKRYSPGPVPAGSYTIEASFAGGEAAVAGKVTIAAGQSVTIKCVSDFQRCR